MGHHVSKSKKRSSNNLTESPEDRSPKKSANKKKAKVPSQSQGGASSRQGTNKPAAKDKSKSKMPFLRFQSSQAKKRYQDQMFEVCNFIVLIRIFF